MQSNILHSIFLNSIIYKKGKKISQTKKFEGLNREQYFIFLKAFRNEVHEIHGYL